MCYGLPFFTISDMPMREVVGEVHLLSAVRVSVMPLMIASHFFGAGRDDDVEADVLISALRPSLSRSPLAMSMSDADHLTALKYSIGG